MTVQSTSSATAGLRSRKRKFEEYATPPKREYYQRPEEPNEQTVEELMAAGSRLANIRASACQLTNEVHPIFADENLCFCECASDWRCVAPGFAAKTPEGIPTKVPQKLLLSHGRNNLVLLTIFQLASQMITHPQTLPFWAGLINAVVYPDEDEKLARPRSERREKFTVHPTKLLHPVHEKHTLQRLANFGAQKIRMHFRELVDDEGKPDPRTGGYNALMYVQPNDPAYKKKGEHHHAYGERRGDDRIRRPAIPSRVHEPPGHRLPGALRRLQAHDRLGIEDRNVHHGPQHLPRTCARVGVPLWQLPTRYASDERRAHDRDRLLS